MIFVVEAGEGRDPVAWFAYGETDFARKVAAGDPLKPWEIHDVVTPRELLDLVGQSPESIAARETFPAICALGDRKGWDTSCTAPTTCWVPAATGRNRCR